MSILELDALGTPRNGGTRPTPGRQMWDSVLITGGTGAVGAEVIRQMRTCWPNTRLILTSRQVEPKVHVESVSFVRWDLTDRAYLSDPNVRAALLSADAIIHLAADVRWGATVPEAIHSNVRATQNLLDAAQQHGAPGRRFVYMSTAFVTPPNQRFAGGHAIEADGRSFTNAYEYSKSLAEAAVVSSASAWNIIRPSLIVGSTRDGRISRYNGLYPVIRMLAGGLIPMMPGYADAVIDTIPVDIVAEATLRALSPSASTQVVTSLGSGSHSLTFGEIISITLDVVNAYRQERNLPPIGRPPMVTPERYMRFFKPFILSETKGGMRRILDIMDVYLPYLSATECVQPSSDVHAWTHSARDSFPNIMAGWCRDNEPAASAKAFDWGRILGRA
jgi:nucleoside-diphosphate-sugar epimerase